LSEGCPCYLALHDIHDATVIDSDAYRRNGGGHFARASALSARAAPATWRCTISMMLPSSTATPTAATAAAI
ncbi:sugar ABC transporter, partial [Klebsiella pneumoniae]